MGADGVPFGSVPACAGEVGSFEGAFGSAGSERLAPGGRKSSGCRWRMRDTCEDQKRSSDVFIARLRRKHPSRQRAPSARTVAKVAAEGGPLSSGRLELAT